MGGSYRRERKQQLVSLGLWAMNAGEGWLVKAVQRALRQEGLTHE
jgi:hypothetical protein